MTETERMDRHGMVGRGLANLEAGAGHFLPLDKKTLGESLNRRATGMVKRSGPKVA